MGLAYGVCDDVKASHPRRCTFVIGPDGKIEQAIATKDPAAQAAAILASLDD